MRSEPSATVPVRELTIPANDGYALAGRVFGEGSNAVVIAGAMGVAQRFYRRFAEYLAANGLRVVTFDYRGIAESSRPSRGPIDVAVWAEQDLDGVLRWAKAKLGAERLAVVGHSLGGQLVPLCDAAACVDAGYFVASQSGYWRHWDGAGRLKMFAVWHALIPATVRVLGRLPAALLGGGEDVPADAAAQWARWGRDPGYVLSYRSDTPERFARMRLPICFTHVADDPLAPRRAVEALASAYRGADVELRTLAPRELGSRSIGHFGFFRQDPGARAWPHALAFLRARLAAPDHASTSV